MLVTARDADHDWSAQREMWGALYRLGEIIRLTPFGETDIAALLSHALGTQPPTEAVRAIAWRTQGNPLLVCELIRSRSDLGGLSQLAPVSVRAMVGARLDGLTEPTRRVLPAAAVLPLPCPTRLNSPSKPVRRHCGAWRSRTPCSGTPEQTPAWRP